MSKFVITQDALNGFMDAFSGRAKQQGQIDGLKIQAAQDQLMANRDKALEPIRQKEAQRNMGISQLMATIKGLTPDKASSMYDYENGQHTNMGFKMNTDGTYAKDEYGAEIIDDTPIDPLSLANEAQWQQGRAILGPLMAMQSYGGDAVDYSKAQGQLNKNGYEAALRQGVMTTQDPSQRNVLVNALSGRSYDPYKMDGYGQMVNTGTGQVQQTAASQAKLGNLNSGTQLNQANAGLAMQRATTEQIKQYEIAADIDLKKIQAQKIQAGMDAMEPQQAKLLFTKQVADEYGNTKVVFDSEAYGKFTQWQVQNGIRSDKQAFAMWSGQGGGNPVNQGQALASFGAAIGPSIAQSATPVISQYDQVNQNQWSATTTPDTIQSFERMAMQKFGKGFSKMSKPDVENHLKQLYQTGAINIDDVQNLHKLYVSGESIN